MWFTVQMALNDIATLEEGPTQYVPGSHYSGRHPNSQEDPEFEGNEPVSIFCKAGDIYLQDPRFGVFFEGVETVLAPRCAEPFG